MGVNNAVSSGITGNSIHVTKIKNGSEIVIGNGKTNSIHYFVDHHFNWFQKNMIKWCFGFSVKDYSED